MVRIALNILTYFFKKIVMTLTQINRKKNLYIGCYMSSDIDDGNHD